MDKVAESIEKITRNTLNSTKDSLKNIFEIGMSTSENELKEVLNKTENELSRYLVELFIAAVYIKEERYKEALDLSMEIIRKISNGNMRALDSLMAYLWSVVRIASNRTGVNMLKEYLLAFTVNREHQNIESTTVLINNILGGLEDRRMYSEAYTFLKHTKLPEGADVGQSSIFYYLSSIVYLMIEEYQEAERMINLAIVKSTDPVFTREYKKVFVLAAMHQGKHPTREYFISNPGLENYQRILLAIKSCSLERFYSTLEELKEHFKADGLYQGIKQLSVAVHKEHIRRIGVIYTRITIQAISNMLEVPEESALFLLQKAISEGVITGYIDSTTQEYIITDKRQESATTLNIEEILGMAKTLTMLQKHAPIKTKTLEELQTEMNNNEYQL
ncbi:26S proteasome regulatory subunit N3 [Nematocida sp. AWRm80]|nr:26S proteasome regulatory subunit N3 [Nematocida sp. AWRm80]